MKLERSVIETILAYIRQGAYPETAAEAVGIPVECWQAWSRSPKHKRLFREVRKAVAEARVLAETEIRAKKVQFWLLHGPGKERTGMPGWSRQVKPLILQDNRQVNIIGDPVGQALLRRILEALDPYPEARLAVAQAISRTAQDHENTLSPRILDGSS